MTENRRLLLAKMGLDCHDTGIVTVAKMLRDAGYEVIYLGLHNDASRIVRAAIDEDVAAIGISFLSGQHMTQAQHLLEEMKKNEIKLPVFCGGVIPQDDAKALKDMGITEVITPGALTDEIIGIIDNCISSSIPS